MNKSQTYPRSAADLLLAILPNFFQKKKKNKIKRIMDFFFVIANVFYFFWSLMQSRSDGRVLRNDESQHTVNK